MTHSSESDKDDVISVGRGDTHLLQSRLMAP